MGQDNSHSVLLPLPHDIYESLQQYGEELQVSVHFISKKLLLQTIKQWRVGKFNVTPTKRANTAYMAGRKLKETLRKKRERKNRGRI